MKERIISPKKSASRAGLLLFMLPVAVVCCHMTTPALGTPGHIVATVNKIASNGILFQTGLFTNLAVSVTVVLYQFFEPHRT